MRVFVTCDIGDAALEKLQELGYELEVYEQLDAPTREVLLSRVRAGIDGLVTTVRDQVDEELFRAGKGTLKVVAQYAVGFDNVEREAANRYQVPFTNTADVLTDATAEFAFFMMGSVSRKLYPSEKLVRSKEWGMWHPRWPFLGDEVNGKTVAVVGTGRIGKAFALKCIGFDLNLLCVDPIPDESFLQSVRQLLNLKSSTGLSKRANTISFVSLEDALKEADFVSLHVPLMEETYHLIGEKALRVMKSSSYLVNSSRGPVVDEAALCRALTKDWIAGAAMDVYAREPLPDDSPLRNPELENRLRLFHHFGSGTKETRLSPDPDRGMAGRCVQGLIDVLEGHYGGDPKQMPYVVNKEAF